MKDKIRLGVLGIGNMGLAHIQNINSGLCPEIEITAICDVKPERLNLSEEYLKGDVHKFTVAEEMFDSGLIDAIIICVPHYFHPEYSIKCMKRGIHVMTEKPAGVYTKAVKEMIKAADEAGVVFGIMMNQRTNSLYKKMREIVQSGELGAIRRTNWIITDWYRSSAYYNSGDWRATWAGEGGGVLLNQCPHNIDLWQWICGMPNKVYSKMNFGKWHSIEVEDDVTAIVEYPNGATGVLVTTTGDTPGTNRFEISFDKGKLLAENSKLYMWKSEISEQEFSKSNTEIFGTPHHIYSEIQTDGQYPAHSAVLNAFAGAILRGEKLIADGREGINGLTISNAMHLSAWLGKEIEIPFDDELFYNELMKRVATSKTKSNVREILTPNIKSSFGS